MISLMECSILPWYHSTHPSTDSWLSTVSYQPHPNRPTHLRQQLVSGSPRSFHAFYISPASQVSPPPCIHHRQIHENKLNDDDCDDHHQYCKRWNTKHPSSYLHDSLCCNNAIHCFFLCFDCYVCRYTCRCRISSFCRFKRHSISNATRDSAQGHLHD